MRYTELRNSIYWFKRRAPKPLVPGTPVQLADIKTSVGQNGYVRFSLKTRNPSEAAKAARKFAHLLDLEAERFESGRPTPNAPSQNISKAAHEARWAQEALIKPTQFEIQRGADLMLSMLMAADEDSMQKAVAAGFNNEIEPGDVREPDRYQLRSGDLPPNTAAGQVQLLKSIAPIISFHFYLANGRAPAVLDADFLPFADKYRLLISNLERRAQSEVVPTPAIPVHWSWEDAFDYYFVQRSHLGDRSNYQLAWNDLKKHGADLPHLLTDEQVIAWRDDMYKRLHKTTVKNRFGLAKAIWTENSINRKFPRNIDNPFGGLKVRLPQNEGTAREEFSDAELRQIFAHPPLRTARAVSVHAGYWLPLLALFHGARLQELTGLEVIDLENRDEGLLMHIRENTIRPRLKNRKKSERSFLVHPKLLELGFLDYVTCARESGVQALFPSLTKGSTFGEEFVTYVHSVIKVAEGRIVGMHCFRHSWETARRNGSLYESAANYMTGRVIDDGSAALYGTPAGISELAAELKKIDFSYITFLQAPEVTVDMLKHQDQLRLNNKRAKNPGKR